MMTEDDILKLIEKGENECVDFKEKHHECKTEFLHDILCLANADSCSNRYIIYGIKNADSKLIGIQNSSESKNQSHFINFLRDNKLNSPPSIELKNLKINDVNIDILIIENLPLKPYFLLEDKKCNGSGNCKKHTTHKSLILRAGVIYTRNADNNTPINSTASERQMQCMWEERFGIRLSPLERITNYIQDTQGWKTSSSSVNEMGRISYYKRFPEFTLESYDKMEPCNQFSEHWHSKESIGHHRLGITQVELKYNQTILKTIELINVEYKLLFPVPIYVDPFNTDANPRAYISEASLDCKIAAIMDVSEIDDDIQLKNYIHGLRHMFFPMYRREFFIDLVD